ncbi:MAG: S8 family serine peptidase [Pyrinomonadaceae bacterium]|nr:S8 family serine peptidase [Pyrinomonadaceae bacterium]
MDRFLENQVNSKSDMSEIIITEPTPNLTTEAATGICPVCGRTPKKTLIDLSLLDKDLRLLVEANLPGVKSSAVCHQCVELFNRAKRQIESHAAVFEQTSFVLPTPLRMNADERFTGRGVTIAFLDSGFYAHPDLTQPVNRILAYHSIFDSTDDPTSLKTTDVSSWHGMMTSVVAAGNGYLSDGFYRGLAHESNLVLVKIGNARHIPDEHIDRGLQWVLKHRKEYGIQVVNISAGGDFEKSYLTSPLCQTVERAVSEGLIVVCAVGNAGMAPGHPVLPPASSPSAISVGGLDDQNSLDRAKRGMYRSSYGPTIDGLQKPEVIAPSIWVAAPILPHTPTADEARLYSDLDAAADEKLLSIIETHIGVDKDLDEARALPVPLLRQLITIKLHEGNVINQHYKYVDGTSFASPIVASTIACMLEANPKLTPQQVKRILIDTAERVTGIEVERQGWGVVSPGRAVVVAQSLRS